MSAQTEVLLRDLLIASKDGDWGQAEPTPEHLPYRVIRGADFPRVRVGEITSVPLRYMPSRTVHRRTLESNDILIETAGGTTDRPTGRTLFVSQAVLDSFGTPATCASFARFLRINPVLAEPAYVYWFLQAMYARGEMSQHEVRHTGVGRFQYTKFAESQLIPLPHIEEQRSIAATLGALDDKIESNRRVVSLIPELIRANVRVAIDGMAETVPVSSLARFVNGGAYTKDASGTGRMVVRIVELNRGPGGSTVYNDIEVPEDQTAHPGDILMSWSGTLGVYLWSRDEAIINQHIFKVIPNGYPDWLVFDRVDAVIEVFQTIAKDKATTMGHIKRGDLNSTLVDLPSGEIIARLDRELRPLWDRLQLAERESHALVLLREALLPELLTGRLRVRDVSE